MESNFELVKITKTITDMLDDHILVCNTEGKSITDRLFPQVYTLTC